MSGVSSLWETAPIGDIPQDHYLNAVALVDSVMGPNPLLGAFLEIERAAGRERRERWGPRTLDLDLLLYGDAVVETERLRVPHPRMHERRFVLEPLAEIWPDVIVEGRGPVSALLAGVLDQEVSRLDEEWAR